MPLAPALLLQLEEIHLFNSLCVYRPICAAHSIRNAVNPILQNFFCSLSSISQENEMFGGMGAIVDFRYEALAIYLLFIYQINTYAKWILFIVEHQE